MSTPDQPDTPQLTRRKLRELRNTASTPIITPEEAEAAAAAEPVVAPLPRAAEPVVIEDPLVADDVDLTVPALTRRAARQQERLRTASVPIVSEVPGRPSATPAPVGAHPAEESSAHDEEPSDEETPEEAPVAPTARDETPADETPVAASAEESAAQDLPAEEAVVEELTVIEADDVPADASATEDAAEHHPDAEVVVEEAVVEEPGDASVEEAGAEVGADEPDVADAEVGEPDAADARPVIAPTFGSGLLSGDSVEFELPASFDQVLGSGHSGAGSLGASNALILSQTPETGAFASPVTSTGEVFITGTFNLPESLGSTGTSRGSSDGKEIDAVLIDGELPASSSPTPIAASAAISTIKSAEDIIKPPAPEKGSRLMLVLGITAGALALALVGVLAVALFTGAFQ